MGRSYVKCEGEALNSDAWCEGVRDGRNYVSEGRSHIIDMKLNDAEMGVKGSELRLAASAPARLTAKVAAYQTKKTLLKKELYDAVYAEDGKAFKLLRGNSLKAL
jgi:hypothetical protein